MKRVALMTLAAISLARAAHAAPAHKHVQMSSPVQPEAVHKIPETGVLDSDDLIALAKIGVERFGTDDQFAVPPVNAYIGRAFSLKLPLQQYGIANYKYDSTTQHLIITFAATQFGGETIKLASKSKNLGSYVGQNAYGAKATVDRFHDDDFGVELNELPQKGAGLNTANIPFALNTLYYEVVVSAAPEAARQIAASGEVLIEGAVIGHSTIGDNAKNAASCEDSYSPAIIETPISLSTHACVVHASTTKIVIRNSKTGEIYARWGIDR